MCGDDVKYYRYNGFLFTSPFESDWNNNIGPALLISQKSEAMDEWKPWMLLMWLHSLSNTHNRDVLSARLFLHSHLDLASRKPCNPYVRSLGWFCRLFSCLSSIQCLHNLIIPLLYANHVVNQSSAVASMKLFQLATSVITVRTAVGHWFGMPVFFCYALALPLMINIWI